MEFKESLELPRPSLANTLSCINSNKSMECLLNTFTLQAIEIMVMTHTVLILPLLTLILLMIVTHSLVLLT